jgi:hypothetical protein
MQVRRLLLVLFAPAALLLGCSEEGHPPPSGPGPCQVDYPEHNENLVTIDQGVWGDVWFWEGDFMPPCPTGTVTAVSRQMRIYEVAGLDDVDPAGHGSFYSAVHTPLVAIVESGDNGFFEAALAPGEYSVFALEDTLLYASWVAGGGSVSPVTVEVGEVTGVIFEITYLSSW